MVSSGSYTPPLARQVATVVRKIFDAIKDNWSEADTRGIQRAANSAATLLKG